MGPRYEGSKISRDAVQDEDEDDPFSRGFDDEESESDAEDQEDLIDDEASEDDDDDDDDEESPATDLSDEEDDRSELRGMMAEDGEDDEDEDDDDDDEDEDDEDEDEDGDEDVVDGKAVRKMMLDEQKTVTAALSQAAKADAEKGRAVKAQRATFDSLLSTRIKLQKALIGANTVAGLADEADDDDYPADAFRAAETAAFNLWSSLNNLRETLESSRTVKKRKHAEFSQDTPVDELWTHMQDQEAVSQPFRHTALQKWSDRAKAATIAPRNRLNSAANQQTIIDVLQEQLSGDRLVKRARTPRSCAPLQLSRKVTESDSIYDDADFYGLMLQSLLEQRSADSVAASASASNIDVSFQMRREAKTKKNIDTKASKGRKLRYTVHEKLQNFMAPEDRSTWGPRQADELFGSLFGRKMGLGEDAEDEKMDDAEDEDAEEAGLMLFRN